MANVRRSVWIVPIVEVNKEMMFLLARRSPTSNNGGLWNFFGGGAEPNEKPAETARRELREEAGVNVSLNSFNQHMTHKEKDSEFWYYVIRPKKVFKPKLNVESDKFEWMTFDDALNHKLHKPTFAFFMSTPYRKLMGR